MGFIDVHHPVKIEERLIPYEKTVIEKKAPTDESIKLLNEMQEKARKNIIDSFKIENNILKGIVLVFKKDNCTNTVIYNIKFIINEKEYCIEDEIVTNEIELGRHLFIRKLIERFNEQIGCLIIQEFEKSFNDEFISL